MSTDSATESSGTIQPLSVGATLRQARRNLDLSEKEVADRLHITMHYVKALETDRYEKLPGAIFAKGYIKSYAEMLGLDTAPLLAGYEAHHVEQKVAGNENPPRGARRRYRNRNRTYVIISVVLFAGMFTGLWLYSQWAGEPGAQSQQPIPVAAANDADGNLPRAGSRDTAGLQPATITPATSPPAMNVDTTAGVEPPVASSAIPVRPDIGKSPAAAGGQPVATAKTEVGRRLIQVQDDGSDILRVSFAGESWVEVNDGHERQIYRGLRQAGDILEITGQGPFNVLLGDAPLTRLEFNGDEVDVSDDIRIDNSARLTVGL